jgi:MFS family permease
MHHDHFRIIRPLKNREITELYIAVVIRAFVWALVGIFVPIYLLNELGYNFSDMLLYFIIAYGLVIFIFPFLGKLCSKIGVKHTILISVPLTLLHFLSLYLLKFNYFSYFIPAIMLGISKSFFWIGYHSDFAKKSDKKYVGQEVSFWYGLVHFIGILGPLIGGLIITNLGGFTILFLIIIVFLSFSVIPLFTTKEVIEKTKFSFKLIFKKDHFNDLIGHMGVGIVWISSSVLWPVFIFFILKSYLSLGIFAFLTGILTSFFSFYVGKLTLNIKPKKMIKIGSIVDSITWFVRSFSRSIFYVFFISVTSQLAFLLAEIPVISMVYRKSRKARTNEYIIFREIAFTLGGVLLLTIIFLLVPYFNKIFSQSLANNYLLLAAFFISGFGSLAWMLLKPNK